MFKELSIHKILSLILYLTTNNATIYFTHLPQSWDNKPFILNTQLIEECKFTRIVFIPSTCKCGVKTISSGLSSESSVTNQICIGKSNFIPLCFMCKNNKKNEQLDLFSFSKITTRLTQKSQKTFILITNNCNTLSSQQSINVAMKLPHIERLLKMLWKFDTITILQTTTSIKAQTINFLMNN